MTTPSKYTVNAFKNASDLKNWIIENWMEKITSRANRFSTLNTGYTKIRPRMFPKGLSTFKHQTSDDFDQEECDNFLKNPRNRIHSVDVIDNKVRDAIRKQYIEGNYVNFEPKELNDLPELDENNDLKEIKIKEPLLNTSNVELTVIDVIATPRRFNRINKSKSRSKNEKVYIRSTNVDNDDIKVIPSVLLTYQTKFTKICDNSTRRHSLQNNHLSNSTYSTDITY